jgi:hypothetical protein
MCEFNFQAQNITLTPNFQIYLLKFVKNWIYVNNSLHYEKGTEIRSG